MQPVGRKTKLKRRPPFRNKKRQTILIGLDSRNNEMSFNRKSFLVLMKQKMLLRNNNFKSKKQATRKLLNVKKDNKESKKLQYEYEKISRRIKKTIKALSKQGISEEYIKKKIQKINWQKKKSYKKLVRL